MCLAVPCGSDTVHGPLPPCPDGLLEELDTDKDGCAEPYSIDSNKLCGNQAKPDFNKPPPELNKQEFSCALEGFMILSQESTTKLNQTDAGVQKYLSTYPVGECVPCGRDGQAPCLYMDFLGCMVQEGYIMDPDTVRPASSPSAGLPTHRCMRRMTCAWRWRCVAANTLQWQDAGSANDNTSRSNAVGCRGQLSMIRPPPDS